MHHPLKPCRCVCERCSADEPWAAVGAGRCRRGGRARRIGPRWRESRPPGKSSTRHGSTKACQCSVDEKVIWEPLRRSAEWSAADDVVVCANLSAHLHKKRRTLGVGHKAPHLLPTGPRCLVLQTRPSLGLIPSTSSVAHGWCMLRQACSGRPRRVRACDCCDCVFPVPRWWARPRPRPPRPPRPPRRRGIESVTDWKQKCRDREFLPARFTMPAERAAGSSGEARGKR